MVQSIVLYYTVKPCKILVYHRNLDIKFLKGKKPQHSLSQFITAPTWHIICNLQLPKSLQKSQYRKLEIYCKLCPVETLKCKYIEQLIKMFFLKCFLRERNAEMWNVKRVHKTRVCLYFPPRVWSHVSPILLLSTRR